MIERVCALAITRANRKIYLTLADALNDSHRVLLEGLLRQPTGSTSSTVAWLRQTPGAPSAKHLLEHLQRLKTIEALDLPEGLQLQIHQNRWVKLAREGGQMTVQHLRDLETARRYATLLAILLEAKATLIDQALDLHDRMIGALFNRAKRRHAEDFQQSGEAMHEKVGLYRRIGEALLQARQSGADPFHAIEAIIPWEAFVQSVTEAQRLAQVEGFDYLHRISEGYFLNAFRFKAAPAAQQSLKRSDGLRRVPADSPTDFVRKRWRALVFTDSGLDRRFYELCALAELKNALRSGDIWVQGSRQFKDFDEYLIPNERFNALREANRLSLAAANDCEAYLKDRLCRLEQQLKTVDRIAQSGELPDVIITVSGLKITPLASAVPEEADQLIRQAYALLPRVKITELLLEVDDWTRFTRHFTHLKSQEVSKDRILLLTAILADAINLGLKWRKHALERLTRG